MLATFELSQHSLSFRCEVPTVSRRHVVMGRLCKPTNLGVMSEDVQIIVLVVAPVIEVCDLLTIVSLFPYIW